MTISSKAVPLLVVAGLLALSTAAHAQNLVTNPGFETGDLTGWNLTPGDGFLRVVDNIADNPHTGDFHLQLGDDPHYGILAQTLTTTPGASYTFSYWLRSFNDGGASVNSFQSTWDGTTVESFTNAGTFSYQQFSGSFLATSSSTTISFSGGNDVGSYFVDDVSVTLNSSSAPEPGTLGLLALGALGLGLRRRRK